jgi:hypothetical protein
VYPTQGGSFDVDVTVARNTWFLQALVALVVGLIVMAFAGGWLWQNWRTTPDDDSGDEATPAATPTLQPEPAAALQRAEERAEERR